MGAGRKQSWGGVGRGRAEVIGVSLWGVLESPEGLVRHTKARPR